MNIKDIIFELANAYVENYKRETRIYNALKNEEIYVDVEKDPYTSAFEKIFNKIGDDFTYAVSDWNIYMGKQHGADSNGIVCHFCWNSEHRYYLYYCYQDYYSYY